MHILLLGAVGLAAGDGGGTFLTLTAGVLSATTLAQILKRTIRRPRPRHGICGFEALVEDPDAFSFPSGHTAAAFGAACAMAPLNPSLAGAELLLASGIAVSRVYLGAHYPLDVFAGVLVGVFCGGMVGGWFLG